ncbi:hypothetical protein D3C81_1857520 [compost metagenome]
MLADINVMVRWAICGLRDAIGRCWRPSKHSSAWISSEMIQASLARQMSAMASSSSRPNVLPNGLCGLLSSSAPPPCRDSFKVDSGVA